MTNTIFTTFADSAAAEKAIGALLDFGVRPEDISVVRSEHTVQAETIRYEDSPSNEAHERGVPGIGTSNTMVIDAAGTTYRETGAHDLETTTDIEKEAKSGFSTTTPADAGAGALKGTAWGAALGILAAVASLAIPGVGIVIGGGALATALGGVAATAGAGALSGAVTGYLKDQGMDEHLAAQYEQTLSEGGVLVAVTSPSGKADETAIRQVLAKYAPITAAQFSTSYVA